MKQLKDIGFGKSSMEDMILDEVEDLSQLLLKVKIHTGCLFSGSKTLQGNSIWYVCTLVTIKLEIFLVPNF